MTFVYVDTETCGLHGLPIIIQYAIDDGPVVIHNIWTEPVQSTLKLIEDVILPHTFVGFNIAFDLFHINKIYNILVRLDPDDYPVDKIDKIAEIEPLARDGFCLKPANALDLMLHARKGPYQATMDREDVRVKRIPRVLANELAAELDARIPLKDIYFARKKDKKSRWKVAEIIDDLGEEDPVFVDLVLSFAPSSALKALAQDALGYDEVTKFTDVELPDSARPTEYGFAPFALAVGKPGAWNGAWPIIIREHIIHWSYNKLARQYASDDIVYTRQLHAYFSCLEAGLDEETSRQAARSNDYSGIELLPGGDDDSLLACCVAAVRWKGYKINVEGITELRNKAVTTQAASPYNFNSTEVTKKYLSEVLSDTEQLAMRSNGKLSTKGIILEDIAKWHEEVICTACQGLGCNTCDNSGTIKGENKHPAALRAKEILDYRHAGKEIELYDKLLLAGRLHASFKVTGALSNRMSGADGLNPQGIKRDKNVRSQFPLAFEGYQTVGGDFAGFEVCLADAVYGDPDLRADLMTKRPCKKCEKWSKKPGNTNCTEHPEYGIIPLNLACDECKGTGLEGTKIHALFGQYLFPPLDYDGIYATKGLPGAQDKYSRSKNGVFALLYGGEAFTLVSRVGVAENVANEAYLRWTQRYVVWGAARRKIVESFCSMTQPGGLGSKVEWREPAEYVESMLGFRRYFTLENRICRVLFDIAESPPKEWNLLKAKVVRREREQTPAGAIRSALFGAAFAIQAGNMRAAANHVIQSSGAGLCKRLQVRFWKIQPFGVAKWHVIPMNIHDEIMCPMLPHLVPQIKPMIDEFMAEVKKTVPLAEFDWAEKLNTWADK